MREQKIWDGGEFWRGGNVLVNEDIKDVRAMVWVFRVLIERIWCLNGQALPVDGISKLPYIRVCGCVMLRDMFCISVKTNLSVSPQKTEVIVEQRIPSHPNYGETPAQ